jgi:hypothetical protein
LLLFVNRKQNCFKPVLKQKSRGDRTIKAPVVFTTGALLFYRSAGLNQLLQSF